MSEAGHRERDEATVAELMQGSSKPLHPNASSSNSMLGSIWAFNVAG